MFNCRFFDLGAFSKNKKGSAHFEMIIGFVFFVGFVVYLFLFLSPWSGLGLPNSALEQLQDSFLDSVNTELSSVFVKANYSGASSCFYIDLPDELFKYAITDGSSFVTRLGGVNIDSDLDSSGVLNLKKDDDFFRVAISPEFNDGDVSSCDPLNDFELGGVVELEVVSYSKLNETKERYYNDYSGLKSDLRVADIFDFAIVPEGMDDFVMMPENGIPDASQVLAKDIAVKVLKSDGSVSNERISVRIW